MTDVHTGDEREAVSAYRPPGLLATLRRSPAALLSVGVLCLVVLTAIAAPWLGLPDPGTQDIANRLAPPLSPDHILGTDELGRDILSRTVHGSRVSLAVAVSAVAIGSVAGTLLGLLAGHYRGRVDDVISWLINVQLAFPFILLMIVVVAVLGPGMRNLIVVLGVGSWAVYARLVRAEVLGISQRDYIASAQTVGVGDVRLIFRHILPNAISPLIVIITFEVASMIIAEAALSFLGLGVDPRTASWGSMLATGREYLQNGWWLSAFPGIVMVITVLCVNLTGDWLRDSLDPRRRPRT